MAFEPGGASAGRVFFHGLHVYEPGSDLPFVHFIEIALDGSPVYRCDGERILAWLDGDTLTWGDGDVYQRVPGQAPICDLSSDIIIITTSKEELRASDSGPGLDQVQDFDDIRGLLGVLSCSDLSINIIHFGT